MADKALLPIIMNNLFDNAVKYCAEKGNVSCNWYQNERCLSLTNDGPGIPEEQLPFLFNRFYRVDNSRSSQIPGSGLGLAIVKKLCDLQHIRITINSMPGKTTFSLYFPQ